MDSEITGYGVTGVDVYGKRFKRTYPITTTKLAAYRWASSINLWRGTLWEYHADGTRSIIRKVWN